MPIVTRVQTLPLFPLRTMPTSEIRERIDKFVQELDLLVRRSTLDALRSVLDGQAPSRRARRPGRPARAAGGASTEGLASKIASHVKAKPGQTVGQIVQATGSSSAAVKKTIIAMLAERGIRKTGQRRGTRYFPAGPGRLPGAGSARKSRGRRRAKVAGSARKTKKAAKPKRKPRATRKPATIVPARKQAAPAPKPLAPRPMATTDVPEALAAS